MDQLGFLGSAVAVTITQWLMFLLLLAYLRMRPVYKAESWPGLSWPFFWEAIRWSKLVEFVRLAGGGVLSLTGTFCKNESVFASMSKRVSAALQLHSINNSNISHRMVVLGSKLLDRRLFWVGLFCRT